MSLGLVRSEEEQERIDKAVADSTERIEASGRTPQQAASDFADRVEEFDRGITAQSQEWGIDRDLDLEDDAGGMSHTQFVNEWRDSVGRAPSQEEYENWIQFGRPGTLRAQLRDDSDYRVVPFSALTGDAETEGEFHFYSKSDLADMNTPFFDPVGEEEIVLLPDDVQMGMQYDEIFEGKAPKGFAFYRHRPSTSVWQDPYVAALAGMAAGALTSVVLGPGGGVVGSTISGAISGGVGAGVQMELLAGDFWEGFESGAATGAIGGSVNGLVSKYALEGTEAALVKGGGRFGAELTQGADVDEAALAGLTTAADAQVSEALDARITNPALRAGLDAGIGIATQGGIGGVTNLIRDTIRSEIDVETEGEA